MEFVHVSCSNLMLVPLLIKHPSKQRHFSKIELFSIIFLNLTTLESVLNRTPGARRPSRRGLRDEEGPPDVDAAFGDPLAGVGAGLPA